MPSNPHSASVESQSPSSLTIHKEGSRRFTRPVRKPVTITKKPVLRAATISKPNLERPKRLVPPLSIKPNADGLYELDATTSRLLEDDLQKIMIKVWQVLPDDAPTEEERMVVEKFRNEASDDLRNALGLNVTKRLLNIFNPLNVKVHFSTKPERKYLKYFLKQYNFVAFKRLVGVMNTFAAQVKTVEDYDNLCSDKNIICGAAKITITPCYRLTQRPKNIKTIYGTSEDDNSTKNKEITKQGSQGGKESTLNTAEPNKVNTAKVEPQEKSKDLINKTKVEENKSSDKTEGKLNAELTATVASAKESINRNIKTAPTSVSAKPTIQKSNVSTDISLKTTNITENKTPNTSVTKSTENTQSKNTIIKTTSNLAIVPKANDETTNIAAKTNTTNSKIDVDTTKSVGSDTKIVTTKLNSNTGLPRDSDDTKTTITDKNADKKEAGNDTVTATKSATTVKPANAKIASAFEDPTATITVTTVKSANTKPASIETPTATKTTTTATKTTTTVKPANSKVTSNETITATKPSATVETANTRVTNTTTVSTNVKVVNTSIVKKTANVISAKPKKIKTSNATTIKTKNIANTTKQNVVGSKQTNKKSDAKNVKRQTDTKLSSKDDDFEELDDHELYEYLMSAGIVLDECSGSDDE